MRVPWWLLLLASGASAGCAAHLRGFVGPSDVGTELSTIEGDHYRLVLSKDSAPLAHLDGHLAEVDGIRTGRRVRVSDWTVLEGLHGMTVWVGTVQWVGGAIGVADRNSGALYRVDSAAAGLLQEHLGEVVLLEGWVDGPHEVRVQWWRPLH
jgi:hypothetical protein